MSRVANRAGQLAVDLAVLSLAHWAAFFIRFDGVLPVQMFKRLVFTWPYVVGFQVALLSLFGVRRFAWRYIGLRETRRILVATASATAVLLAVRVLAGVALPRFGVAQYALIPAGVIGVDFVLGFLGITGVRALRRVLAERAEVESRRSDLEDMPTILVGAGEAGVVVAREIERRPDLRIAPLGFLDDDALKVGTEIHGLRVLGTTEQLEEICEQTGAKQVLITIANTSGSVIRRIADLCEKAGISAKIIPGVYEIVGGSVNLSRIRPIAIEDLLGRDPVLLDNDAISSLVRDRIVLVTGAGGSIGSELCRQVVAFAPRRLLLVERAENNLFEIHRELCSSHPNIDIVPVIADICDEKRLEVLFADQRPVLVLHAAAHKHVPMMEWNAGEAVKNNVLGTKCIADLSDRFGVEIFVQISTDKAVNPTSVMGATKRVAEMYLQRLSERSVTRFTTVRFGNVLGSTGSVVRIFREQIARGGPVTVTHPDMRRYFMLTAEACQLVLEAASVAEGGEVFLLDMGDPVRIVDLAHDMIRLSGYEPDIDIKIEFSGVRPGEKLFEELLNDGEGHGRTVHPKILIGRITPISAERIEHGILALRHLTDASAAEVRSKLAELVPNSHLEAVEASPASIEPAASASRATPAVSS